MRPAFTTIEIMTAVAIMVLLLAIFAFAFRNVGSSVERKNTQNLLEQLRSNFAEITREKAGASKMFEQQLPMIYQGSAGGAGTSTRWDNVPVDTTANQGLALEDTKRVIALMQSNPNVKTFLDGLQAQQKRQETVRVQAAGETPRPVPVILDYWGNPILFVFDGLLRPTGNGNAVPIVTTGAGGAAGKPTGGLSGLVTNKKNASDAGEPLPGDGILRSPDNRPFWFSAGPDGNYQTHDDNVYSFEN